MSTSTTSIAQEFYKLREEWARIDPLKSWKLAIWVAQYTDIELINHFMETERLAIGVFEDIFFRFDTPFTGDQELYERELWLEYQEWFAPSPDPKFDIYGALKQDGILPKDFKPDIQPLSGFENLLKELLRFRAHLKGYENKNFLLYFPSGNPDAISAKSWFVNKLKKGIPDGIRLATMDYGPARKIYIPNPELRPLVAELIPRLHMREAINNDMDKADGTSDTVSIENRLRKQIRVVMETTTQYSSSLTGREVKKMLSLAKASKDNTAYITSLLIASQAYYTIKDTAASEAYAVEAIARSRKAMDDNDPAGYPVWRSCMMLRGGLFASKRKWEEGIKIYDEMAEEATQRGDAFFIMEGHRISAHLHYLRGRRQTAFEKSLLALVGGSYLDKTALRQSTFVHAAFMAVHLGKQLKAPDEMKALYHSLSEWLGKDWQELLEGMSIHDILVKPKARFSIPIG
ncbi:hypothetical protein A8C56_12940 [Niabella ginsenosidivorans]|uniref:Uncharacterized protein n=1 Tax=Niabella ginsenosidivorans TaxID=1176587 RepID=A0A1A9I281_9BACT|nr:hypothetical protein [Niabella ginsenosidivorans]ANH81767.1 hypothetical protein A8C56_12940 [Niabella ginsenosidivorans]